VVSKWYIVFDGSSSEIPITTEGKSKGAERKDGCCSGSDEDR